MKYLELDARHQECHGLARALVGSPLQCTGQLLGVFDTAFMAVALGDHGLRLDARWIEVVRLPLDTLKLCPFAAMREGVGVACKSVPTMANGKIESISISGQLTDAVIYDQGAFDIREITLDLDNLPKGARIVEVEK